jgi:putative sigma-54 modulation protein
MLRAEERTDDIFAAFDAALDKIQRQIEKHKGKRERGWGAAAPKLEEMTEVLEEEDTDSLLIVRRKKFTLNPMDEREAIEQSQMLDHEDFFVFYNINTDSVNVLYRRRDGTYGLIETEIG